MNDGYWGWIKLHRSLNSIWLNSEIERNIEKEIQIKAETIANKAKNQILANISHELRTPLGTITGLISCFNYSTLTNDQKDMIYIIQHTSDFVLSIVYKILDKAKLKSISNFFNKYNI
ncbi:hypothetical protein C2G38_2236751 [Gigaspora rosea]|uniref:histidine kinase n=1 Tax=Gigaspora rosea TaxID=44941 RepID=A0A397TSJ2_9GLOM|nr:hypothetical protein C2G38_2236751 [Gigaspora rosea]